MNPLDLFKVWRIWRVVKTIGEDKVMMEKLKSRKLLALIITAILTTINGATGILSDEMMQNVIYLTMTYIGGQGVVDAASAVKK